MTTTTRERFEDFYDSLGLEVCQRVKGNHSVEDYREADEEKEELWSFIETLLEEARQEGKEKLATFIRENRNTVTLVQIEEFISSL